MIKLDKRLNCVCSLIDKCDSIIDIGSDHGYLPIKLIEKETIKKAFITDVNKGPLENAKNNFVIHNIKGSHEFILSNGLLNVNNNSINGCSICGMGGELIIDIINSSIDKVRNFDFLVLQPMNSVDLLRKYLHKNDFTIIKEDLVKDGRHYYNVLKVINGKDDNKYDDIFYEVGYNLFNSDNKDFLKLLEYKISVNKNIIKKCKSNKTEKSKEALIKALDKVEKLERVKKEYESKRYHKIR